MTETPAAPRPTKRQATCKVFGGWEAAVAKPSKEPPLTSLRQASRVYQGFGPWGEGIPQLKQSNFPLEGLALLAMHGLLGLLRMRPSTNCPPPLRRSGGEGCGVPPRGGWLPPGSPSGGAKAPFGRQGPPAIPLPPRPCPPPRWTGLTGPTGDSISKK